MEERNQHVGILTVARPRSKLCRDIRETRELYAQADQDRRDARIGGMQRDGGEQNAGGGEKGNGCGDPERMRYGVW